MELVGRFLSVPEAEVAASRLRAAGIEATVFDGFTMAGILSLMPGEGRGVRLMVPTGMRGDAMTVLREAVTERTWKPLLRSDRAKLFAWGIIGFTILWYGLVPVLARMS
jgi:hypothetical protein